MLPVLKEQNIGSCLHSQLWAKCMDVQWAPLEPHPDTFTKLVHLPPTARSLGARAHSCPWPTESYLLTPSDGCLAIFFCSIPLLSSSDGPHSGTSLWRFEVIYSSGLNWNVLSKGYMSMARFQGISVQILRFYRFFFLQLLPKELARVHNSPSN